MAFLLLGAVLAPAAAAAGDAPRDYIVSFDSLPLGIAEGESVLGGEVLRVDHALGFAVVRMAPSGVSIASAAEGIASIEPDNELMLIDATPGDPQWGGQYGPAQVRAPEAWDTTFGSAARTVCVVDTGVRYTHEDLSGSRYLGGYDFVNKDNDPMDDQGHGTHVAGTAVATTNNGVGVAGVAQAGYYAVKVLNAKGSGATSDVASGVRWCADQGPTIISLSLGGSGSSALKKAVTYAWEKGSLVVAAAGNDGPCKDCVHYPGAYPEVITVTCTAQDLSQCTFSSEGPEADLAAPGHKILSTWHESDSSYKSISGTSMSTPHVSGVAALVWSHMPSLTNEQLRAVLEQSARDLGEPGHDVKFGHGLVDARAALDLLANGPPAVKPKPAPSPSPLPSPAPFPGFPGWPGDPTPKPRPEPRPEPTPDPNNQPPVAEAGPDVVVELKPRFTRGEVALDGSASTDPDGRIKKYLWTVEDKRLSTREKTRVLLPIGEHVVTLTVTDDKGATATDTLRVTIVAAPEPSVGMKVTCDGLACTFEATSNLPGTAIWRFGDRGFDTGNPVTHTYRAAGAYEVHLRFVTDDGRRIDIRENHTIG